MDAGPGRGIVPFVLLLSTLAVSCGGDAAAPTAPDPTCIQVRGHGETVGHVRSLVGSGVFVLDGDEQPVHVGVYLNNLRDIENNRKRLTIVYQFTWPAGDMMLTEDDVILLPFLEENRWDFEESLTIKTGTGMFAGLEGKSPLKFKGSLVFGPPPSYTSLGSVEEHFEASGLICFD